MMNFFSPSVGHGAQFEGRLSFLTGKNRGAKHPAAGPQGIDEEANVGIGRVSRF